MRLTTSVKSKQKKCISGQCGIVSSFSSGATSNYSGSYPCAYVVSMQYACTLFKLSLLLLRAFLQAPYLGAVHKVRHAQGGGGREGVTVCDRGMGVKSM